MARVTTVITSINSNTVESPNIDSTSWSTDSGTITLNSDLSASINIGDVINDSSGNDYLITGISGAVLTCQDFDTTTDPATGAATIGEAYATPTLWEADLDAGTNAEVYKSGDDAQGEGYNNGAYSERIEINGGGTIGLSSVLLTAPESDRHDGTDDSGTRLVATATTHTVNIQSTGVPTTVEWWEIDLDGQNVDHGVNITSSVLGVVKTLLVHGVAKTTGSNPADGIRLNNSGAGPHRAMNCIVYDIAADGTRNSYGISVDGGGPTPLAEVANCTVHNVTAVDGIAYGVEFRSRTQEKVQNTIATDTAMSGTGSADDFDTTSGTVDHNLSSDTSASGTGSLISKTSLNQFVSNAPGTEDLHLKAGADAFEAGDDLGTTPTGVNIDIDGFDRNAGATTWSMGAHDGDNLRGAGAILTHPGMAGGMQIMSGGMRG